MGKMEAEPSINQSELNKDGKKEIWRGKRKGVGKERKLKERWLSYNQ